MDDQQKPPKKERTEAQMAALAAARAKAYEVRKQNTALRKAEREVDAAALQAVVKERRERVHVERKALIPEESADDEGDEEPEEIIEERIVKKKKRKPKPPVRRRVVVVEESDTEEDEPLPEEEVTTVSVPRARPPDPLDRVRDCLFGF